MKSLKEQIADIETSTPRDLDPEDDDVFRRLEDDETSEEDEIVNGGDGREHYEMVEKSRLRQPEQLPLGKQYTGAQVRRDALEEHGDEGFLDEEEDDTFAPVEEGHDQSEDEDLDNEEGEDEEIDSDEAFGSGDEDKFKDFKFLGSKSRNTDRLNRDDLEDDGDGLERNEDEDEDEEDVSGENENLNNDSEIDTGNEVDMQDIESEIESDEEDSLDEDDERNESDTAPEARVKKLDPFSDREKLRAILSNDAAAVASSLSTAAKSDISKGKAVKQQYQTFDRLLDARIKLQKGLTASHDLKDVSQLSGDAAEAALKAQEAALRLFSTIESLRNTILDAQPTASTKSNKRKRESPATLSTSSSDLWSRMQSLEAASLPYRREILNKWSAKTRASNLSSATRSNNLNLNRNHTIDANSITTVLNSQLISDADKLYEASTISDREPNTGSSLPIYNDTQFYQTLLRDLIASRSMLSNSPSSILPSEPLPTKLHQSGSRNKKVDTKASKGRKIRYTVHEKLQNFCAQEDRSTWSEAARLEFFGSLFGGQGLLREDEDEDDLANGTKEGMNGEIGKEEEALRLFRS